MILWKLSRLKKKLKSKDSVKRSNAAKKLGSIKDTRAVELLMDVLIDEDYKVRSSAATAIVSIGDEKALTRLAALIEDDRWEFWSIAADSLQEINWQPVNDIQRVRLLIRLRKWEQVQDLGALAVESLLSILRTKPAEPLFLNGVRVPDWHYSAQRCLQKLESVAIEPLLTAFKTENSRWARRAIVETLGEIGDERATPLLTAVLGDNDGSVCSRSIETLGKIPGLLSMESLIEALKHEDVNIRLKAIGALHHKGDKRAVQALESLLEDKEFTVIESAESALKSLGWQPENKKHQAISAIVSGKGEKIHKVLEPEALPALFSALKSISRCELAAEALGEIGDPRAITHLFSVLEDEGNSIANSIAAVKALGKIGDERTVPILINFTRSKAIGQAVVEALEEVLKMSDSRVSEKDLRDVARLDNIVQYHLDTSNGPQFKWVAKKVDCSKVNNLAYEELISRGLKL